MGGKSPKSPPAPVYKSIDGREFTDPNRAQQRNQNLQLAAAVGGFNPKGGQTLNEFFAAQPSDIGATFNKYASEGGTAADYRVDQRLAEQEKQTADNEALRKSTVEGNRGAVDTAFGGFDDPYFNSIAQTYSDYYMPQLDTQYEDAAKQLKFKLARQGISNSTTAGDEQAKMQGVYDIQKGAIANNAKDSARQARESVAAAKNQLLNYADSAADKGAVDSRLASETGRLRTQAPELSPMGQVFSNYLSPVVSAIGSGLTAEAKGYRGFGTGLFSNSRGGSSYNQGT